MVALKHGQPDHFVHAHPLNETAPQDGIVDFEIELQEKGMYTIYAQFNINGQINFSHTLSSSFRRWTKMEKTSIYSNSEIIN